MLRGFTDSAGLKWQVWEVFPTRGDSSERAGDGHSRSSLKGTAFADGWLCFEAGEHKRRLAPIPKGWQFHDEGVLERLCSTATAVPLRRIRSPIPSGESGLSRGLVAPA
jgi:hypothetical protein